MLLIKLDDVEITRIGKEHMEIRLGDLVTFTLPTNYFLLVSRAFRKAENRLLRG